MKSLVLAVVSLAIVVPIGRFAQAPHAAAQARCSAHDEWGRYACARIVGHVVGPDGSPTPRHAFVLIRVRHTDRLPDVLPVFERADSTGHFDFMLLKYTGDSTSSADTLHVPITATWLDESRQVPQGVPQPVLGADSVDLPVVFAPSGAVAPADTVVFHLASPPPNQKPR
jgi:hypothetical protein